jgi:hypothetical protein
MSPLHFRFHYFERVSILAEEGKVEAFERQIEPTSGHRHVDAGDANTLIEVGFQKDDETQWRISVTVSSKPDNDRPFTFDLKSIGYFQVDKEWLSKQTDKFASSSKLITNTAASILYSSTREYLLLLSSRLRSGPILLRSVSFTPIVVKREDAVDMQAPDMHSQTTQTPASSGEVEISHQTPS